MMEALPAEKLDHFIPGEHQLGGEFSDGCINFGLFGAECRAHWELGGAAEVGGPQTHSEEPQTWGVGSQIWDLGTLGSQIWTLRS